MNDCKECPNHRISPFGDVGCVVLMDWLTREERKEKKVLDNCPLKEQK